MTLDDLRIFQAVCETRNLSAVARSLGCTQPAVAQHVARLERELGVALVELPAAELESLDLPEKLLDAVTACRSIRAHGARLRQEMYIAKVLRHVDVEPIRAAIERRSEVDRRRVRREQGLEQWLERLLADEAAAWTELAGSIDDPAALQQLRTLARQARAEKAASRPPAAARQLFRRLRELLESRRI
jgi:ribosome-associated protein